MVTVQWLMRRQSTSGWRSSRTKCPLPELVVSPKTRTGLSGTLNPCQSLKRFHLKFGIFSSYVVGNYRWKYGTHWAIARQCPTGTVHAAKGIWVGYNGCKFINRLFSFNFYLIFSSFIFRRLWIKSINSNLMANFKKFDTTFVCRDK